MAAAVDEPTAEELTELAQLAVALTGDPQRAADLVGITLVMARRRTRRRSADRETAHRDLMVQQFVSARPAAAGPPPGEDLPTEFREVATRLAELPPLARAILVLVRLKGLTLAEVAGILDRTPTKVQRELEAAGTAVQADPYVVRAVLETLSWRAPDEDAIRRAQVPAERRLVRRQHRIQLLVAGVVVLLLAGVAVPTVWALRPLPARAAGDWSYGLAFSPPMDWQVEAHFLTVDEELLAINGPDINCEVQALLPAAAASRSDLSTTAGERAWVRGRPVRISPLLRGFRISWPYAGSGVATLTCDGSGADRSSVLALANRLQFRPGQPMPVPVAFGVLPDGLRPAYAGRQKDQTFVGLITGPDLESAEIIVFAGLFGEDFDIAEWTPREIVQINGVPAQTYVDDELVALCLSAAAPDPLCVGSDIDDEDDDDAGKEARIAANLRRVRAVMEGMRIAPDLNDQSTWFDAREALPG